MKSIIIRILLIVILPPALIYVAFTKTNYDIPYDDYAIEEQDVIISNEINRVLSKQSTGLENIKHSQAAFNNLIYNNFRETENAFYDPSPECDNALCDFVIIIDHPDDHENAKVGIRGIWGVFEEENLTLFIAFKANYVLPVNTVIEIGFHVMDSDETLILEFSHAKLGKTPIPKALLKLIINSALKSVGESGQSVDGNVLKLDPGNLRFELDKVTVAEEISTYPQIQTMFLDASTPYSVWVFFIWSALDL